MKKTITLHTFRNDFQAIRPGQFSYEGLAALFEYLEDLESQTGEEIELDVTAICCEYTEYEDLESFWQDYDKDEYASIEDIQEATTVIMVDEKRFIIHQF